tara:strand:+ start:3034 stop:3219 length:186 start_codon:yes stop_codon:yes gene_type:complete
MSEIDVAQDIIDAYTVAMNAYAGIVRELREENHILLGLLKMHSPNVDIKHLMAIYRGEEEE